MTKLRHRRIFMWVWAGLGPLIFWCFWTPIPFSSLKIVALGAMTLAWLGAFALFQRARLPLVAASVVLAIVALWPSRDFDSRALSRQYVASMRSYQGTRYVWGGENGRGLDCSGLMRRGLIDALLFEGLQTKNPSLWREAALVWWRDCSAREMKSGYSGRIERRFEAVSLNAIDTSRLQPGDLAVLRSGVHVLAWVGGKTWIQADPNLVNGGDKVILTTAPSKSGWFGQRVVICRWKILAGSQPFPARFGNRNADK